MSTAGFNTDSQITRPGRKHPQQPQAEVVRRNNRRSQCRDCHRRHAEQNRNTMGIYPGACGNEQSARHTRGSDNDAECQPFLEIGFGCFPRQPLSRNPLLENRQ